MFLDNAGGSQVAKPVVDRVADFLFSPNVQFGASYATSAAAFARHPEGRAVLATMMNADRLEDMSRAGSAGGFGS